MYAKTLGAAINGLEGYLVTVEVDISQGLPCFEIVGLATTAVREAKERVRAAIHNTGYEFPMRRIIVNLGPADRRKSGSALDLSIAMAILLASGQLKLSCRQALELSNKAVFIGELSLQGELRPVSGVLAMCTALSQDEKMELYTHEANGREAKLDYSGPVYTVNSLQDIIAHVEGKKLHRPLDPLDSAIVSPNYDYDMSDIKGQVTAKRVLEIAAVGGHHILLEGPPGAGKSMLMKRLPTILPALTRQEQVEITKIYSVRGELPPSGIMVNRPFRSPHHSVTMQTMVGGGLVPQPGEITLSHCGVLFLDEAPECRRATLEALRQPLEDGKIVISRINHSYQFPASFILALAMNPCPCGWYGYEDEVHYCRCRDGEVQRYKTKLSGPLLDRIDLSISVTRPSFEEIENKGHGEISAVIRERVTKARTAQTRRRERLGDKVGQLNRDIPHSLFDEACPCTAEAKELLKNSFASLHLSMRAYDRLVRVARSIADLGDEEYISYNHVAEALSYRL